MMGIDPWTLVLIGVGLILCWIFRGLITVVIMALGALVIAAFGAACLAIVCAGGWFCDKVSKITDRIFKKK